MSEQQLMARNLIFTFLCGEIAEIAALGDIMMKDVGISWGLCAFDPCQREGIVVLHGNKGLKPDKIRFLIEEQLVRRSNNNQAISEGAARLWVEDLKSGRLYHHGLCKVPDHRMKNEKVYQYVCGRAVSHGLDHVGSHAVNHRKYEQELSMEINRCFPCKDHFLDVEHGECGSPENVDDFLDAFLNWCAKCEDLNQVSAWCYLVSPVSSVPSVSSTPSISSSSPSTPSISSSPSVPPSSISPPQVSPSTPHLFSDLYVSRERRRSLPSGIDLCTTESTIDNLLSYVRSLAEKECVVNIKDKDNYYEIAQRLHLIDNDRYDIVHPVLVLMRSMISVHMATRGFLGGPQQTFLLSPDERKRIIKEEGFEAMHEKNMAHREKASEEFLQRNLVRRTQLIEACNKYGLPEGYVFDKKDYIAVLRGWYYDYLRDFYEIMKDGKDRPLPITFYDYVSRSIKPAFVDLACRGLIDDDQTNTGVVTHVIYNNNIHHIGGDVTHVICNIRHNQISEQVREAAYIRERHRCPSSRTYGTHKGPTCKGFTGKGPTRKGLLHRNYPQSQAQFLETQWENERVREIAPRMFEHLEEYGRVEKKSH